MKFNQLKISNFGSIGSMSLPLEGQGLTLLLGRNEDAPLADSNGAGKSLPLDAFTWALWGSTVRGISSDEVINNKKKKDCVVEVSFSDGNKDYQVIRYRKNTKDKSHKPNDLILKVNGEEASGSSMAATQDMVTDILGLDFTTFCAMMPGAGINVASMTDAEVKGLLEKLLRTQVLSKASDEARKRLRALSDEHLTKTTRLQDLDVAIQSAIERSDDLREKQDTFSHNQEYKRESLQEKLDSQNEQRSKLLNSLQSEQQLEEDLAKYIQEEAKADQAIRRTKELSLQADLQFRQKISEIDKQIAIVETRQENLEEQKTKFAELEGDCPTCGQDVDPSHREALLSSVESKITKLDDDKKVLQQQKLSQNSEWTKSSSNRKDILKQLSDKQDKAAELVAFTKIKRQELKGLSLRLEVVEESIAALTENLAELCSDENPYKDLLERALAEVEKKQKEKEELDKALGELSESTSIMKFWVDSFSPQGLRSFMLENVTPILNNYAKTYSDLITSGEMEVVFSTKDELKSGKKKEKFNIKVSQKHGGDSYASNSSGERARANLIIALALGELAAMRADKVIPFRFLDEPFESIDETGTEAIVNLLNQMRDKYNTVYVITHQDYLKQLFSNKITVVKKNGFSALEK